MPCHAMVLDRRIATRYDRCAHTFTGAICIAAIVIFWLWALNLIHNEIK
jgi:hypothetical protein